MTSSDANPFNIPSFLTYFKPKPETPSVPADNNPKVKYDPSSLEFDMSGDRLMYIFNHKNYPEYYYSKKDNPAPPTRIGTERDEASLKNCFEKFNFKINTFKDYIYNEIIDKVNDICVKDHSKTSCVAVVILTHGEKDGLVYAADKTYKVSTVISMLMNEARLAGKPKLFFIQACRGARADSGHQVMSDGSTAFTIPTHSESLVMRSSVEDFVSFRESTGSWMIQALCEVINNYHRYNEPERCNDLENRNEKIDILRVVVLTNKLVAEKMALAKIGDYYLYKKQMPETVITMTKFLKL